MTLLAFRLIRSYSSILLVLLAITPWAHSQSADQLIARNLVARGGVAKLHSIRSMVMTGTISFGQASSPITVNVLRPNMIREDFKVQGSDLARAYDGSSGWEKQGGKVRVLEVGELNNIKEEAENAIEGPLLDYATKGSKAEALGKDVFGGKPVFKLKITTSLGTSITQFLDATTFLEVHEEIERSVNGKLVTIVEDIGDYRDVDGVKFAHRFVSGTKDNPSGAILQIEKMTLNSAVSDTVFRKPVQ